MSRPALILAAHGSRHDPAANEMVRRHAANVAATGLFDSVTAAFHQGESGFTAALDAAKADQIIVVPLMTSDGYYTDVVLPRELRKSRRYSPDNIRITSPVGLHPGIVGLVHMRLRELLEPTTRRPSPDRPAFAACGFARPTVYAQPPKHPREPAVGAVAQTSVAIIGHGTPRHPRSRQATEHLAHALRALGEFHEVMAFFLDESPMVEEVIGRCSGKTIVVIPFLVGRSHHAAEDIPRRLGLTDASNAGFTVKQVMEDRVIISDEAVGAYPQMAELIVDLASRETVSGGITTSGMTPKSHIRHSTSHIPRPTSHIPHPTRLRLGTRPSRMALWQADLVATQLRTSGRDVDVIEISTIGDRLMDRPMTDLPGDAPFADDLEQALLAGDIDLAVHCLKDMPATKTPGLTLPAFLARQDPSEALICRHTNLDHGAPLLCEQSLKYLPPGAVVGTSSPRRAAQLARVRPDLVTRPIRGPVDDRVRQVRAGRFDAAVLATAGLERLGLQHEIAEILPLDDFLPAPGQAVLVVQTRSDDPSTIDACRYLDHAATRAAADAEWEFLRAFDGDLDWSAAALATIHDGRIRLHARLIHLSGRPHFDVVLQGGNPIQLGRDAARWIDARCSILTGVAAGARIPGARIPSRTSGGRT